MATIIKSTYIGDGRVESTHGPTNSKIVTDLPPDNGGKGRLFSPTDLFATSLSSCILTIMAKFAEKNNIDITGGTIEIEKIMLDNPRRIGKLLATITFPDHVDEKNKNKLKACINACPIHRSIHPKIETEFVIK